MNKNLRKFFSVLLTFTFIFIISGCSNSKNETTKGNTTKVKATKSEKSSLEKSISKSTSPKSTKSSTNNVTQIKNQESEKQKYKDKNQLYLDKLNNIEIGLKDLSEKYGGTTVEMKQAAGEEYKRWDNALNEIYGALKKQLSSSTMNKLKKEQLQWISARDKTAKKDSLEFKGGTMESLEYTGSLSNTTKNRCYELVNKYMNNIVFTHNMNINDVKTILKSHNIKIKNAIEITSDFKNKHFGDKELWTELYTFTFDKKTGKLYSVHVNKDSGFGVEKSILH